METRGDRDDLPTRVQAAAKKVGAIAYRPHDSHSIVVSSVEQSQGCRGLEPPPSHAASRFGLLTGSGVGATPNHQG